MSKETKEEKEARLNKIRKNSIFKKKTKGKIKKPLFAALYSGPGIGKTDFGKSFPAPLFFDFEESTHNEEVNRIDGILSYDEFYCGLQEILEEDVGSDNIDFKSIIIDTCDELERLIHNKIAEDAEKESIENIGWQKGYDLAVNYWSKIVSILRRIRDKHGTHTLFISHAAKITFKNFEKEASYQKYAMGIHPKASNYLFGQVEMVLFAKKEVSIKKDRDGNVFAKDSDRRVLCTSLSALYDAKNRVGLPPTLPMPVSNGFDTVWGAYNKAFDFTPKQVIEEAMELVKEIKDEKTRTDIMKFLKDNDKHITKLKVGLNRIKTIVGEQTDD
jgi:hypothetical protein